MPDLGDATHGDEATRHDRGAERHDFLRTVFGDGTAHEAQYRGIHQKGKGEGGGD